MIADCQPIAFYDFDRTLCRSDSITGYLLFCVRQGAAPASQLLRAAGGWLRQKRHPEAVSLSKQTSLSFIRGKSLEEMDRLADRFLAAYLRSHGYAAAAEVLRAHREQGWLNVVVSASPEVYLRRLPQHLPVDAVLATPCLLDGQRRYSGRVGANCKGEEKVRRIRAWLTETGRAFPPDGCEAYGDSLSDLPMLQLAGRAVLVNPDSALIRRLPGARRVHWR